MCTDAVIGWVLTIAAQLRKSQAALKHEQQLDDEYERWQWGAPAELSDSVSLSVRALAADHAGRSAATTIPADRQRIARLLLERVIVTVDKAS